jgi:hypothetical protein
LHNRIGRTDQAWRAVLNFVARVSVAFGGEPIIARRYIVTKKFTVNEGEKDECDIFMHRSFTVFNVTQIEELLKAERPRIVFAIMRGKTSYSAAPA